MNTTQALTLTLAIGMIEYNYGIAEVARRAKLNEWKIGKAREYKSVTSYIHYLSIADREPFMQALLDLAKERGYIQ